MSELFKSKMGMLLAGIHLLTVLSCLLYLVLIDRLSVLPVFILMILTAPWGLLLMFLPGMLGISPPELLSNKNNDLLFIAEYAIGGLINAFILYLLGFLLTKAFNYLSQQNQSLS